MGADLSKAVEQAVDDLVEDDSSSAHREGRFVKIEEDELVENVMMMLSLSLISMTEN